MDETCCDLRGDRCGAGRRGRRGRGGNGCAHPPPARAPATRGRRQRHLRTAGARQAQPHQPDGPLRTGYLSAGRPAAPGCAAASSTCRLPTIGCSVAGDAAGANVTGTLSDYAIALSARLGRSGAHAHASAAPTRRGPTSTTWRSSARTRPAAVRHARPHAGEAEHVHGHEPAARQLPARMHDPRRLRHDKAFTVN